MPLEDSNISAADQLIFLWTGFYEQVSYQQGRPTIFLLDGVEAVKIPPDVFEQLGRFGPLLLGWAGIGVALMNQRRQLNAQLFIEFSGRFQELLRMFPTEAWLANRNPFQALPPPSAELTDCVLYCLQFVADAYYLHKGGYVSREIWKLWEREMQRTVSGPLFRREWKTLATEFSHAPEFLRYIDASIEHKRRPWR
jgi:hypothetical protein